MACLKQTLIAKPCKSDLPFKDKVNGSYTMSHDNNDGPHDPFNAKYLFIALGVALALPMMHVFLAINVYLLG